MVHVDSLVSFAAEYRVLFRVLILTLIALLGFGQRLFSIIRYESIIHEFDPWFNYRATLYLVKNGWYEFINWFDETAWYPLGRNVGGTVYPGIMATSATIYYAFTRILGFPVEIRDVCVFLAPAFSGMTAFATYLLTRELKDPSAGLLAAALIVICPGYISRSVAGSYDNEAISIFLMMACFYLWVKASKTGSALYAAACAMSYYYMVASWGGYAFVINMIPLHAFTLICMGRYSSRLYVSYSTFFVLGTLASMTVPFVGFLPTRTSEHMAAIGVFGLMQLCAFTSVIRGLVNSEQFRLLLTVGVATLTLAGLGVLTALTARGVIAPWTGRFYSLWDTGYAAKHIPIIASVSEHQPTAWSSFYMDFQWLMYMFPVGIFYCLRQRRNEHIFAILYAVTASYFAGVMVRLILTLAPIVCVAGGLAGSQLIDYVLKRPELADEPVRTQDEIDLAAAAASEAVDNDSVASESDERGSGLQRPTPAENDKKPRKPFDLLTRAIILAPVLFHLAQYVYHAVWVTQMGYSSPSVVISSRNPQTGQEQIIDDFREAYYWLRRNTPKTAKILSWWDYGYQIAGFSDRITIVDNNTWNNRHIATVGKVLSSSEPVAYKTMRQLDANYVLVIAGALNGYSGDDINKFLWMIRIAAGVYPESVRERDFYTQSGAFALDNSATPAMKNSILYKCVYHRMAEIAGPRAMDAVRQMPLHGVNPKLSVLEEVFSSEHFMVRIFKVKTPDSLGRPHVRSY